MRTTLTIEDDLARALKRRAQETGRSFKSLVNEALRAGLEEIASEPVCRPYRLESVAMGQVTTGLDMDKALLLAGRLEDEELARKLELRK
jgi:plasmid stability protein